MQKLIRNALYILFTVLFISACGGGGGGSPPPEEGSSNWDEMVWDQDDWS